MDITELITSSEGRRLEFKQQIPDSLDSVLRTIIAFSNESGGDVIIGIDDEGEVVGIDEDPFELEERLASSVYDSIAPVPSIFFQTHTVEGSLLFRIKVLPGAAKPYYLQSEGPESGSYVRVGSTNRKADQWIVTDLKRQGRNKCFDEELETGFDCNVFSMDVLSQYLDGRGLESSSGVDYLEKEKLAVRFNGSCHPTVGGLLLFSETLPEPYEYAGFTISVYGGTSRSELSGSRRITTNLLHMPKTVLQEVAARLGHRVDISELRRTEELDIPLLALRESVVNAICHRNYAQRGSSSKIDIFSDRVEITSPGTLPVGITLEDLGEGISEVRNRQIVKMFRKAGYIEQLGTGISRMRRACRDADLPEPEFQEVGNFLKVILSRRHAALPDELKRVYNLLSAEGQLPSSEIAEKLGIHRNTALKRLNKLREKGLVEKKGRGSNVKYKLSM